MNKEDAKKLATDAYRVLRQSLDDIPAFQAALNVYSKALDGELDNEPSAKGAPLGLIAAAKLAL